MLLFCLFVFFILRKNISLHTAFSNLLNWPQTEKGRFRLDAR